MGAFVGKAGESRSLLEAFRGMVSGNKPYPTEIPRAFSASTNPPRVGFFFVEERVKEPQTESGNPNTAPVSRRHISM
jgi:hypothetical protein